MQQQHKMINPLFFSLNYISDDTIVHLAPFIDKYNYNYSPYITVGAAIGYTSEQYLKVNGYSNEYSVSLMC